MFLLGEERGLQEVANLQNVRFSLFEPKRSRRRRKINFRKGFLTWIKVKKPRKLKIKMTDALHPPRSREKSPLTTGNTHTRGVDPNNTSGHIIRNEFFGVPVKETSRKTLRLFESYATNRRNAAYPSRPIRLRVNCMDG